MSRNENEEAKLDAIASNMTEEQQRELVSYRGGCSCHMSPPCGNCSDPLTMDEAIELGFVDGD